MATKKVEEKMSINAAQKNAIAKAYVANVLEHNGTGLRLVSRLMQSCSGVTLNVADARAVATSCADSLKWDSKSIPQRASEIRVLVNAGEKLVDVMKKYAQKAKGGGLGWNSALTAARMLKTKDSVTAVVTALTTKRSAKKTTGKTAVTNALRPWLKSSPQNAANIEKAAKVLGSSR